MLRRGKEWKGKEVKKRRRREGTRHRGIHTRRKEKLDGKREQRRQRTR